MYKAFKAYDILCIGHDVLIRQNLVDCLEKFFQNVYYSDNYHDGYDLYLEFKPRIILCDVQLENDSKKMIEKIRKSDFSTIIIISNANYNEKFLQGLINLHINHYMFKSTEQENLLLSIKKAFGDKLFSNIKFTENLYFNMETKELFFDEKIVKLRKREKDFIMLLCQNKNYKASYFEIEERLWQDREMSKNALKTFVNEIRKKLPFNFIVNIMQEGYKLEFSNNNQ